jgi:hypothetical protein
MMVPECVITSKHGTWYLLCAVDDEASWQGVQPLADWLLVT